MATRVNLVMHEGNAEIVDVVLTPSAGGDLSDVTGLEFVIKPSSCDGDDDENASILTTPTDITITTQTPSTIVAVVTVPAAALVESYERVYRLDALIGVARRTALYGTVTVVDL